MLFKIWLKKFVRIFIIFCLTCIVIGLALFGIGRPQKQIIWGLTFSSIRAEELGYDPQVLLATILTDLHPKKVRIPAYWSELEPQQDQFDFSKIENLLTETDKRGTDVIVVLGKKQPRWPECHQPDWFNSLQPNEQNSAILSMLEKSVTQLKHHQSITAWQIENEQFFEYGPNCPKTDSKLYKQELNTVAQLDSRPLITTDSGEKGLWLKSAWSGAEILGSTMYREVYHDKKGKYITYELPWWTYNIKAGLIKLFTNTDEVIGVELQAEPWLIIANPKATSPEEQLTHMNPDVFKNNIAYATKVGFPENYLWGVEWWYWMAREHNDSSMLNEAKTFFNKQ